METKQAVLPLSAPVSTSILLCFGNRHNHITVFDETIFVSSMTLYRQAVSSYIQRPFCVAKCLLGNPKPFQICTVPMQAARFCKTLFQHSIYCEEIGMMSMLQPRLRNRLKYRISVSLPSQIRYTTGLRFLAWTDLRLISFILPMLHFLQ